MGSCFSEIWIGIKSFSFKKCIWKRSFAKTAGILFRGGCVNPYLSMHHYSANMTVYRAFDELTHWDLNKISNILLTTFQNTVDFGRFGHYYFSYQFILVLKCMLFNPDIVISALDWTACNSGLILGLHPANDRRRKPRISSAVQYGCEIIWKIIVSNGTTASKVPPFHGTFVERKWMCYNLNFMGACS